MPKQPDTTTADPVADLDRLQQELTDLPAATAKARRDADVKTWMNLINRAESLPGLIAEAEVAALRHRLTVAWQSVDAAVAAEGPLTVAADDAQAAVEAFDAEVQAAGLVAPDSPEGLERVADRARLAVAFRAARQAEGDAKHATDWALYEVVQIETELSERPEFEPEDGAGPRALPRRLTHNIYLPAEPRHPLIQGANGDQVFYEAGTAPPRWLYYRLRPGLFEPRRPVGVPTIADIARSADRDADWQARSAETAQRLTPGNRQHRAVVGDVSGQAEGAVA